MVRSEWLELVKSKEFELLFGFLWSWTEAAEHKRATSFAEART